MLSDSESIIETLALLEAKHNGPDLINVVNVISNLLKELDNRKTKATYSRKFSLGKLSITLEFDGMK